LTTPSSRPRPASSLKTETTIANHTRSVPSGAATPARNRGRGPKPNRQTQNRPARGKLPPGGSQKPNEMTK
jgi:hypothetical protein